MFKCFICHRTSVYTNNIGLDYENSICKSHIGTCDTCKSIVNNLKLEVCKICERKNCMYCRNYLSNKCKICCFCECGNKSTTLCLKCKKPMCSACIVYKCIDGYVCKSCTPSCIICNKPSFDYVGIQFVCYTHIPLANISCSKCSGTHQIRHMNRCNKCPHAHRCTYCFDIVTRRRGLYDEHINTIILSAKQLHIKIPKYILIFILRLAFPLID